MRCYCSHLQWLVKLFLNYLSRTQKLSDLETSCLLSTASRTSGQISFPNKKLIYTMDWAAVQLLKGEEYDVFCLTPSLVWGAAAQPPVPPVPAPGGLQGGNATGASSTDTAASPSLARGGQMDPGSSWLNGEPGTGRVCSVLFVIPCCLMCAGTFDSSASATHRFFISSPFLGLPTCVALRGSSLWCSQRATKMKEADLGKKAEVSCLSCCSPVRHPTNNPSLQLLKRIHGKHSPEQSPVCVYPVSHGCAWRKRLTEGSGTQHWGSSSHILLSDHAINM